MRVNTKRVLEAWRGGRMDHREQSIWTDGTVIYSYGTCLVAPLASGKVVLNVTKYSVTTSNKQSNLRYALHGLIAAEVDGLRQGVGPETLVEKSKTLEASAAYAARVLGEAS